MKTVLAFAALCAVVTGPFIYDGTADSKCVIAYDTSFNGLYIIKERVCYGRLIGMENSRKEIARKPLFEAF